MNNIFLKAAKLIDRREERFSCNAVDRAQVTGTEVLQVDTRTRTLYSKYISPEAHRPVEINDFEGRDREVTPEARLHRVIALLFIGEVWDDL